MDTSALHSDMQAAFCLMLRNHGPLSTELKSLVLTATLPLTYNNEQYLLKAGQVATKMWFLFSGYVRWYKEEEDKQATVWISTPGSMVIVPFSFQQRAPSAYYLQAISPAEGLSLSYEDYISIRNEYSDFFAMINSITDTHSARLHEYVEAMRLNKGEERMKYLQRLLGNDIYMLNTAALSSFINMGESRFYKLRKMLV